jgi:oxygen tolerance protein BatD
MRNLLRNRIQLLNRGVGRVWFALFFVIASPAYAATFTASLDRTSIVLGDEAMLSLNVEGGQPEGFSDPRLDGLQIVSQNTSSKMVVTGGSQSVVYTYSFGLQPQRAGEFVIPPITTKVNGQVLTSQPLKLKVAAVDPATMPPATYADKMAFLWVVLPKTNLYLNEPVVAEFRIYLRSDVRRSDNLQGLMPEGSGLTAGPLVQGQHYSRRVGNASYTVVPLSVAITPVKTGTVSINPMNASIVLNNSDVMQRIWGDGGTPVQAPLTSPRMDLQVSPLPTDGVPPGFTGAVGTYTMTVNAGPTNVVAGDPITLRIQISGQGALDSVTLPDASGWQNFKAYPPTAKVNPTDQLGIEGSKTFEEIVTPQNSDVRALPPISFSFFDPEQKKYRTLTQPAMPLVVKAANPGSMPAVASTTQSENPKPTADVIPIKQHLGVVAQLRPPLIQQPWFLALQGVPVFALVSSVIWRKRKENLANNPRLRRQRHVAQLVREGLGELHHLAAENKSDEFFATMFRLLQEQLGERLDLPASAITEAVIDERLRPRGVPTELLASLHELFQACNLARYTPVQSSQELAAIIPNLENVLNQLRELKV